MYFAVNNDRIEIPSWERTITLQPATDPYVRIYVRIFKRPDNKYAHMRIDEIEVLNCMSISVGGGPATYVELEDMEYNSSIYWNDLQPKVEQLLAQIQHEYPKLCLDVIDPDAVDIDSKYNLPKSRDDEDDMWF